MVENVADGMWEMLVSAGVQRCYGIVGDALNPVIDALRRNGEIEFVHVRHEEYGVFAAVAESILTGRPVAVCGTAGPGVTHLINGLLDARKEGAAVIAVAGDSETSLLDTSTVEELNPYKFFDAAALYIGRIVNPGQLHQVVSTAVTVAIADRGPTVISLPGDVATRDAPKTALRVAVPSTKVPRAADEDLRAMADLIEAGGKIAIFGGDGGGEQLRCAADAGHRLPVRQLPAAEQGQDHSGRSQCQASRAANSLGTGRYRRCADHRAGVAAAGAGKVERSVSEEMCQGDRAFRRAHAALRDQRPRPETDPAGIPGIHPRRGGGRRRAVLRRHRDRGDLGGAAYSLRAESAPVRVVLLGVDGQRLTCRTKRDRWYSTSSSTNTPSPSRATSPRKPRKASPSAWPNKPCTATSTT
nr:thiamine pyrophosphate-binding protein [Nocardia inohanensis]